MQTRLRHALVSTEHRPLPARNLPSGKCFPQPGHNLPSFLVPRPFDLAFAFSLPGAFFQSIFRLAGLAVVAGARARGPGLGLGLGRDNLGGLGGLAVAAGCPQLRQLAGVVHAADVIVVVLLRSQRQILHG